MSTSFRSYIVLIQLCKQPTRCNNFFFY